MDEHLHREPSWSFSGISVKCCGPIPEITTLTILFTTCVESPRKWRNRRTRIGLVSLVMEVVGKLPVKLVSSRATTRSDCFLPSFAGVLRERAAFPIGCAVLGRYRRCTRMHTPLPAVMESPLNRNARTILSPFASLPSSSLLA